MARRLLREEGFMCGGSSGTAMDAAIRYIKENNIGADKKVVVLLPDNIRNYMTKHLNADWMYERGYMTEEECAKSYEPMEGMDNTDWGTDMTVSQLNMHPAFFLDVTCTCEDAVNLMRQKGFDQFPVKDEAGKTYGVVTATSLLTRLGKKQLKAKDVIKRAVVRDLRQVSKTVKLNELVRILTRNSFVLVEDKFFITFSDVFDALMPPVQWQITQAEFDEARSVSTRNQIISSVSVGLVAFVAGAMLRQFWK